MRLSKKFLAGTISALMLLCVTPAFAQTSAQQGYSKPGGIVQTQVDNGSGNNPGEVVQATTPERANQSRLPFTGLDLVLVVAAGGLLLGLGLGMRRLSRPTGVA